jgi:hypothetical protein
MAVEFPLATVLQLMQLPLKLKKKLFVRVQFWHPDTSSIDPFRHTLQAPASRKPPLL